MKVRLHDFEKYFGRTGIKYPRWFAMDCSFLTRSENFEKLSKDAVVVYVYVAGECVKVRSAEIEINLRHASIYCMMSAFEVAQALEILSSVHVLSAICSGPAQNLLTEGKGREGKGIEGKMQETQLTHIQSSENEGQLTYVPCNEIGEPLLPKRIRPARAAPAPDDFLEQFKPVSEILTGRGIPRVLQEAWLKSYTIEFMLEKIKALRVWELTAGAKGKKQNWAKFYSSCFSKDWDRWSSRLPSARPQAQERKSFYVMQLEAERAKKGEANGS